MSKNTVIKLAGRDTIIDPLTELLRTGAEQLIYQAVEAELLELLAEHSERQTEDGKAGVVRNGYFKLSRQVDFDNDDEFWLKMVAGHHANVEAVYTRLPALLQKGRILSGTTANHRKDRLNLFWWTGRRHM